MFINDQQRRIAASKFLRDSLIILRRYHAEVNCQQSEALAVKFLEAARKIIESTPRDNVIKFPGKKHA